MAEEEHHDGTPTQVVPRPIEDEMRTAYIDYAMSVIVGRALPDVRDGLKPVHRRVLYAMYDLGNTPDKPHRKSARTVGDVLGKYHPHGDQSIYDTLVRMAQEFSLRYPLIDGQGNFGSVDGDNAAAMRYTEARLSKIAMEVLEDLDKETVDFTENFDATLQEPVVLPGKLPNLIVNGSTGIAVGMATNIPPHQLGETVDALKLYLEDPTVPLAKIMEVLPGPDFPTGGIIHGRQGIFDAYATGRGIIKVRSKTHIEAAKKEGRERIIIDELPYMVNKANLLIAIADLVKEKRIEDIADLRDESDRDGMRVVIELKKNANPELVLNNLFKHTQMETSFGVTGLGLVDGRPHGPNDPFPTGAPQNQPVVLGIKGLLSEYCDHRRIVVTRRTQFLLRKAQERLHIVKGLLLAVGSRDNLDAIIRIIREAPDAEAAQEALIAHDFAPVGVQYVDSERVPERAGLHLDALRAKAILDMRLGKLTGLEVRKLREEGDELFGKILDYEDILARPERVKAIILQELEALKEKFNDKRRTEIVDDAGELAIEDLIPDEHVVVTITNDGYIKRIPIEAYRLQNRGGKGLIGMETKEQDYVVDLFSTTTHRYVLFFSNRGKVYWLKAYHIPEGQRAGKGKAIVNLLEGLETGEKVQAAVPVTEFSPEKFLFFATKKGVVKKTALDEYSRPRTTGIIALSLDEGDELIGVGITNGKSEVVLAKAHGKSIRFEEGDVRPMGRPATGVKGVEIEGDDEVVSLAIIQNPNGHLLTVTENGYGKRTEVQEYRLQGRGGSGIITIQTTTRNGKVVAVREVLEQDEIIVTSTQGMVIRVPVSTISVLGRNVQGNRIMRLENGDHVMALAVLARADLDEAALAAAASAAAPPPPVKPDVPFPGPAEPQEPHEPHEPGEEEPDDDE